MYLARGNIYIFLTHQVERKAGLSAARRPSFPVLDKYKISFKTKCDKNKDWK